MDPDFAPRVYAVVRAVPSGRVASYGAVAALAGRPRHARLVGRLLAGLPEDSDLPWWRIVDARGAVALPAHGHVDRLQRALLTDEGVRFTPAGRVAREHFLAEEMADG
ncbi:MAG TPA: MGMT family protein [Longimicrobiales bacterium]|nr:MGMT family protein [Longimicrobiales bacterium]